MNQKVTAKDKSFGLPKKTIQQIRDLFAKYPEIRLVKIYGSRSTGNYKAGSDIDLVFYSESDKDLSARLSWELDELPTPYLFDIFNYNNLEPASQKEIDKYAKSFINYKYFYFKIGDVIWN
ncbi:MAG: nucleotidyltransferase domain-containing protein [Bdellovibrionales bacterium]|nr:nucleotidyltransferase domain-containing protein [Bdellovibrionales bacterium]